MRYLAVIEQGPTSWVAYVPDLPVCAAVGDSRAEVEQLIAEAVALYLETLAEQGVPLPPPTTSAFEIEVA
jgi:predicted RNase H-like HicB family nuclease